MTPDTLWLTDERKWRAARAWVDAHSGADTWRVLQITHEGFQYDGPGFFSPRLKRWDDDYAEGWARYWRGAQEQLSGWRK